MSAVVMQVIRTDIELRGNGTTADPYRRVVQFWSFDGALLAEVDHWAEKRRRATTAPLTGEGARE
jgi:hypothetical protein